MDIRPGQLVVTNCSFEAHEVPINWFDEEMLRPPGERKTVRNIKIYKNEILLVLSKPIKEVLFSGFGCSNPVTRYKFSFLRNKSYCFMVTVVSLEDYIVPINLNKINV